MCHNVFKSRGLKRIFQSSWSSPFMKVIMFTFWSLMGLVVESYYLICFYLSITFISDEERPNIGTIFLIKKSVWLLFLSCIWFGYLPPQQWSNFFWFFSFSLFLSPILKYTHTHTHTPLVIWKWLYPPLQHALADFTRVGVDSQPFVHDRETSSGETRTDKKNTSYCKHMKPLSAILYTGLH